MISREAKRLALLAIVGAMEVELGAHDDDELEHPESGLRLPKDDARAVRRVVEELCATMKRRADRLKSVGQVR